jgi:hypothetical protein
MATDTCVSPTTFTVTVTERFTLQCADQASWQALEEPVRFGPLDLLTRSFLPVTVVLVYLKRDASPSTGEIIPVERLRRALHRLLDYYPHLTGRIVINSDDRTPQIERLGDGAELISAHCDAPLTAFEDVSEDDEPGSPPRLIASNLPAGGNALLPPFDPSEDGMSCEPILTVQHTRFSCGSVSLGLRLRHLICDADGFFQLAHDLAELYRGFCAMDLGQSESESVNLANPPHTRSYLSELHDMSPDDRKEALAFCPRLFELAPAVQPSPASTSGSTAPPVVGRLMRFTASELASIKAEANFGRVDQPLSTFDALTAHLWQSVHRARVRRCEVVGMTPSEAASHAPLQFLSSVNMRGPIKLGLPHRYFPNCVLCPVFSLSTAQLLDDPLGSIAAAVHDGIRSIGPLEARQTLRWIAAQPDKQRVRMTYRYEEGGFLVSQWSKFGMYRGTKLDVAPVLVFAPFTPISLVDGLTYFLATEDQLSQSEAASGATTGSIDVTLSLSEPLWAILDQDARVRRHRGW